VLHGEPVVAQAKKHRIFLLAILMPKLLKGLVSKHDQRQSQKEM